MKPIRFILLAIMTLAVFPPLLGELQGQTEKQDSRKWAKDIARFEAEDRKSPPPKDATLFVGSSTIVRWNLQKSFPGKKVINRGFGGSHLSDSVYYARQLILKHRPSTVVVYAGDNDIARGVTPLEVSDNFEKLVKLIRTELPETRIIYLSIKPSPSRWKQFNLQKAANQQIEKFCKEGYKLLYVDMVKHMLGADGKPMASLYVEDGLHLSKTGYELWTLILKPILEK